ncbi:hypothetical protein FH968_07420 [Buttiauxella sp. B2]|uniref:CDP-glycerol glycerophosphotransferase family protein n=1 Tax=Buttiauxella sp. B2 TaxID=2587812 RepID=UPI00111FD2A3|nr:CDP-glycerol glycerophosphotransferase family protein [Buttiauxella sp. B2]TNV21259.1 hypothetical protein FH968_07420 [Buttiauxella sp. B2]
MKRYYKNFIRVIFIFFIGYPLFFLSHFVPRNKKSWVIGSSHGFRDNAKYFYIDSLKYKDIKCYWVANDSEIFDFLKSKSLCVVRKNSFKGVFVCLTSKVYVYDYSLLDINLWTSGRSVKINLWHGVGIKKIQHAIKTGRSAKFFEKKNWIFRVLLPQNFIKPDLFLSTSEMMDNHFCDSFDINKERIMNAIYPRCSIFDKDEISLKDHIKLFMPEHLSTFEQLGKYSKVYIYMPTWRDSGKDIFLESGLDLNEVNSILKAKGQIFLLKLHPNTVVSKAIHAGVFSNIILLDKGVDIYPFLPKCDVLITDYSSIYYDFILMNNKKVIFFLYDFEFYKAHERDLAFDFDEYTSGLKIYNSEQLLEALKQENNIIYRDSSEIKKYFWGKSKGNCSKIVRDYVFFNKKPNNN